MGQAVTTVTPMRQDDVGDVARLEKASQPRPWTPQVLRDELGAENRHYLVARTDELVGFGGVMVVGEEAHVTNLLVAPGHRGEGLGKRLMIDLINAAVRMGSRHLTLEVRSTNESAKGLYRSLGMVPVGVRPGYYQNDDALIMWAHDIDRPEFLEALE